MRRLQWIYTWGHNHDNKINLGVYSCYSIVALLYPGYITLLQECIRAVGETWHPEHFSCFVSFYFTFAHFLQDQF